ncbi:M23 family metallopeptidase [Salinibacillus xinjiangensis]|uniref:Peptidoglycan DD-metalloendopeptidase family protein n=1 Tax=Salinibacillus xinjiangensis TaxID=1229268 RepID=A0A6G1X2P0_9BACI|nr:M23 family metallopeptidase [Salinibacillus xinjiangensis]MRG85170.1 peptidoglycan DD-metalloendopeptidase family protein [Salinibacillus xinjiangensis]
MKAITKGIAVAVCLFLCLPLTSVAEEDSEENKLKMRLALYEKTEGLSQIPWYYFAAIDQYEHNIHKETASSSGLIGITFPKEMWNGNANPIEKDQQHTGIIEIFNGIGDDGDGDKIADRTNDEDILYTMANMILKEGKTKQDIKIALWKYYHRELTVHSIMNMAKVFQKYQTLDLEANVFPVPTTSNYSYRNTWGDPRGFGGRRIHEGTDIFANYGVPVRSTTYGVIEMKGWNRFGGWRIGIRDTHNIYHYYAHLNGFEDNLKVGQVVKPGDTVGYVGASGYGPKGTSGKFPPHLHYGMYKDNGEKEWSFDPYPYLRKWEKVSRSK